MTLLGHSGNDGRETDLARLTAKVAEALRLKTILVDERPTAVRPCREELRGVVLPLLLWCRSHSPRAVRGLVGIAAPPGAGKSVLVAWLSAAAEALRFSEFAFMSLDGYHLPNAILQGRRGRDPDGKLVSLLDLKGTPDSYDAERLLADLQALRSEWAKVLIPGYSRITHDPIPAALAISQAVRWVFVEGNFLLLDAEPWRSIRRTLDRKIYLDASDAVLRERLRTRHRAGGRDARWIEEHYHRTDHPDICVVRRSAGFADIAFRWDPTEGRIRPIA